jgi:beta-lactamase class A
MGRRIHMAIISTCAAFLFGLQDRSKIESLIRASPAEKVALAFYDLESGRELLINPDESFHAASTMKVAVMMEVFRQVEKGQMRLDEMLLVRNEFKSIADGSSYSLDPESDSERELYWEIGRTESVRNLIYKMITVSSNLATNILIERVRAERVTQLMKEIGADGMRVLRGVEDGVAYRKGLNNTTTARALMVIMRLIAERRAISAEASDQMNRILLEQKFNDGIPALLPPSVRVAHKTGSITRISHDAAIVYPPGRKPYVLVVLTKGIEDERRAQELIAKISRTIYEEVLRADGDAKRAKGD